MDPVPDGAEALVIDGGGFDGGNGYFIANAGDDLHVMGTMAPMISRAIGLVRDPRRRRPRAGPRDRGPRQRQRVGPGFLTNLGRSHPQ